MVEQMLRLLFRHTLPIIFNGNLNRLLHRPSRNNDMSAWRRVLSGVIGQRVEHEQREGLVGLNDSIGRLHHQINSFQPEPHVSFGNNIKQFLQGKAFDLDAQLALA